MHKYIYLMEKLESYLGLLSFYHIIIITLLPYKYPTANFLPGQKSCLPMQALLLSSAKLKNNTIKNNKLLINRFQFFKQERISFKPISSRPYATNLTIIISCGMQSNALDKSMKTAPTI